MRNAWGAFISALRRSMVTEAAQADAVASGQPWFYRRLVRLSGRPMALLGYPREHTVPRETWPATASTQPNPARILALEPERAAPTETQIATPPGSACGALKRLVALDG
jgi:hypothetical protein